MSRLPDRPVVDAHQHFWDLARGRYPWLQGEPVPFRYGDYAAIRRTFLPADYRREAAGLRVIATVHVEAEWDRSDPVAETRWLAELREREGLPTVAVAWADLTAPDVEETLAAQAAFPFVRGIRFKPAAAPSPHAAGAELPGSMGDPAFRRGYARLARFGLSYDLQVPWWHLGEAARLCADFPDTALILNHAGLPADRSREGLESWKAALRVLAREPNAFVKISGIGVPGRPWTAELQREVVLSVIDVFGADRCMFASNWPVDSLVAPSLRHLFEGFAEIVAEFSADEQQRLFCANALRIYRIDIGEEEG